MTRTCPGQGSGPICEARTLAEVASEINESGDFYRRTPQLPAELVLGPRRKLTHVGHQQIDLGVGQRSKGWHPGLVGPQFAGPDLRADLIVLQLSDGVGRGPIRDPVVVPRRGLAAT